jgi:hypothetical protein
LVTETLVTVGSSAQFCLERFPAVSAGFRRPRAARENPLFSRGGRFPAFPPVILVSDLFDLSGHALASRGRSPGSAPFARPCGRSISAISASASPFSSRSWTQDRRTRSLCRASWTTTAPLPCSRLATPAPASRRSSFSTAPSGRAIASQRGRLAGGRRAHQRLPQHQQFGPGRFYAGPHARAGEARDRGQQRLQDVIRRGAGAAGGVAHPVAPRLRQDIEGDGREGRTGVYQQARVDLGPAVRCSGRAPEIRAPASPAGERTPAIAGRGDLLEAAGAAAVNRDPGPGRPCRRRDPLGAARPR